MIEIPLLLSLLLQAPPPPPPPPANPLAAPRDAAQQPKGTAVVRGHVFTPEGRPLRRAQIRLAAPEIRALLTTSTGIEGEFEIREVPAGRFTLQISRGGFLPLAYGAALSGDPGQPIEVRDGAVVEKLKVTLQRAGVISGQLTDDTGEPMSGVDVWAMQEQFFRGRKRMVPVSSSAPHIATDDTGQYRLTGLAPGEYLVMATTRATWMSDDKVPQMLSYAPTYFPGTAMPSEGRRVKVAAGQEVSAIDFPLAPIRAARLSGTAIATDGLPMAGVVGLMHEFTGPNGGRISMSGNSRIAADGSWQITDLSPGEYTVRVTDSRTGETASRRVSVSGVDIDGIQLSADPAAIVSGRVVTDRGAALPAGRLTVSGVTPLPFDGVLPRTTPGQDDGVVAQDGTFTRRLIGGDVILRLTGLPPGWWLRNVIIEERDHEGIPIRLPDGGQVPNVTLVVTDRLPEVNGTVVGSDGKPAAANVVLFPADPARWVEAAGNQKTTRPGPDGKYRIDAVKPGDYFVIAVQAMERWQINDPDFLREHQERATKITVADTVVNADLRVVR
jgi:hypothetical protein